MKHILTLLVLSISYVLCGAQATSLTVDNQTPGWLSSKINYGDQQTVENLTITGYINGTDINFIRELSDLRALHGVLNLSDVNIVSGGEALHTTDDGWSSEFLYTKIPFQKVILPKSLQHTNKALYANWEANADTLIISSTTDCKLDLSGPPVGQFVSLPEGIKTVDHCDDKQVLFPLSCNEICGAPKNVVIFAPWDSPIKAEEYVYSSTGGWRYYPTGTIYVPNGKAEAYKNSDFKDMTIREYGDIKINLTKSNQRIFVNERIPLEYSIEGWEEVVGWIEVNSDKDNVSIDFDLKELTFGEAGNHHVAFVPRTIVPYFNTLGSVYDFEVYEHVESIEITTNLVIEVGENKKIESVVKPVGKAYDKVTWKTSDPSVATIDDNGEVKGISKGQCTIIATTVDGNHKAYCDVNVIIPVESVTISSKSISVPVNSYIKFGATVKPYSAWDISVNWSSSDENVVQIDNEGNAKAVSGGTAKIFATSNYNPLISDFCEITVIQPVTGVLLNQNTAEITVDGSLQLVATVLPENSTNKNVTWSSSDVGVAMVSGNGIVYGIKPGQATIMATTEDGGFSALCKVAVGMNSAIEDITIDNQESVMIYSVQGLLLFKGLYIDRPYLNNGIYILKTESGKTIKLIINK